MRLIVWSSEAERLLLKRLCISLKTDMMAGIPQDVAMIMTAVLVVVKTRTYFNECTMAI